MKIISNWPCGGALAASLFCFSHQSVAAVLEVPAQYPTIRAAVDAAQSGDTVRIAAGDYYEQILIKTNLTVAGEPGAVLHAFPGMDQNLQPWTALPALLAIVQCDVQLVGLTIDGDHQGDPYRDPDSGNGLQGVFYLGSGGSVSDCKIRGFRGASLNVFTYARALVVWNGVSAGTNRIEINITSNSFEDNEQSITLAGDDTSNPTLLRTTFTIEGNTITGSGPATYAVDGVVIYTGASGVIRGNTISGHQYTGSPDPYASGIDAFDGACIFRVPPQFIPLQPIRIEGNTFRNNNDHLVLLNAPKSVVVNNVFEGSGPGKARWGALAISGAGIRVENNDFSNVSTGVHMFGPDHFFDGFPLIPIARNPLLIGNWFSNVPKPLQIRPGVTNLQQQGTRLAPPFPPEFQSTVRTGTNQSLALSVRAWHGVPITLESSTNLVDWTAAATNVPPLPKSEFTHPTSAQTRQQFYQLRGTSIP